MATASCRGGLRTEAVVASGMRVGSCRGGARSLRYNVARRDTLTRASLLFPRRAFRATSLNPSLSRLQPYPFERLRALLAGVAPDKARSPINLSIGEPRHPTPQFILDALAAGGAGVANYPTTARRAGAARGHRGVARASASALRRSIPATQVLPVLGSREALFAFAQTVVDRSRPGATVRDAEPVLSDLRRRGAARGRRAVLRQRGRANAASRTAWHDVPDAVWARTQLVYVCSPDNPTGRVTTADEWRFLFELSDRHGFVIAADECYSEVYFDEARPPLGALAVAHALGRERLSARSCRSAAFRSDRTRPGLRSGYVAGDAALIKAFLLYRTYHGSAMSPAVAAASLAAWSDEAHVRANRAAYAAKFARAAAAARRARCPARCPMRRSICGRATPGDDAEFARRLLAEQAVTVLPGSFFAREAHGINPGRGRIRIALVAQQDECAEAIDRIVALARAG